MNFYSLLWCGVDRNLTYNKRTDDAGQDKVTERCNFNQKMKIARETKNKQLPEIRNNGLGKFKIVEIVVRAGAVVGLKG